MSGTLQYWGLGLLASVLACGAEPDSEAQDVDDTAPSSTDDGTDQVTADDDAESSSTDDGTDQATSNSIGMTPFEPLEIDEISVTGFSPQDAADALAGEHSAVLRYQDAPADAGAQDSELTVHVEPTFEPLGKGLSFDFGDEAAVLVPYDEPEIRFKANVTLQTSDGTFDEETTGIVRASSLQEGYVGVDVKLADVGGAYESNPPDDRNRPVGDGSLQFTIYVMSDGTTEGRVMDEDMTGSDQSAVVARWGPAETR